jgi:superfamily II RNA helicase
MKFGYDFILKTIQSNNLNWMDLVEKSYYYEQVKRTMNEIQKDLESYEKEKTSISISKEEEEECCYEVELKERLKQATNAARRKLQGECETWKNKHPDRIWDLIRKNYARLQTIEKEILNLKSDLEYYKNFEATLVPYFCVLQELDYMNEERTLTQKGVNATEINEGNPILLSQMYEERVFDKLSQKEILLILTCFMESEEKEPLTLNSIIVSANIKDILHECEKYCKKVEIAERKYSISFNEWKLNYEYIDIISSLFQGDSIGTVCTNYSIMEGNLTRFLLKLLNIVDELKNIGMLNNDVTLLEKLENVQAYDFYKIANPDSLYLHI